MNQFDLTNRFRKKLQDKNAPALGIWSMLNSFNATEGLAWAGYDWICIDAEHAPVELSDMVQHLRILDPSPSIPIVRLPWNDRIEIKRALDAGATTIMLPFIQNADEARAAVRELHYPPIGKRGVAAMHRASRFGAAKDYLKNASSSLFLIVQIETVEAISNISEIANVEGVDAVFFGPGDLSASMGYTGEAGGTKVTKLICDSLEIVQKSGKFAGALAVNPEQATTFIQAGYDFVNIANDCNLLFSNARNNLVDLEVNTSN